MPARRNPSKLNVTALAMPLAIAFFALTGCTSKPNSPPSAQQSTAPATPAVTPPTIDTTDASTGKQTTVLALPNDFGRATGDWDQIAKRGALRVLVVINRTGFFYDKGRPRGAIAEAMEEFAMVINKQLKTGARKFKVVYLPMPPGQLLAALNDGTGDIACTGIIITPEREKLVDFTAPIAGDVRLVVVTSKSFPAINSVDDLSGKAIYVNGATLAKAELDKLNERFKQAGKPEIEVNAVDPNLTEEDLLEMENAGLIPTTVAFNFRAQLWAKVLPNIVVTPAVIKEDGKLGWAMRKGSPQLKAVMDDFIKTHGQGTVFGNTIIKRYAKDTKWVKNSTSEAEMKKFQSYVQYFQKYAAEYNFDYLMLAAQGYQESMLNQDRVSPRGAVGVMQVLPKYAAAKPISIPNVRDPENNIHAGAKMLAHITNTYFNEPGIDHMNKTLFTFAAYNAGQNRIVRLRKEAKEEGLDPNKWFGNVELVVAKDIGQETVQYVANIYKYYVAYKMALEQKRTREQAKQTVKPD
ncbi:MAG TPA: transporter substrate-binding domain-containing protein [Candidatus Limnocylindrales bacterium]|nr:transporter substrate-binding domain-containing protein [Candidatus Limnocylindrales bacterium]